MIGPGAKALNKPLLIVRLDRKLAGLAFLCRSSWEQTAAVRKSRLLFSSSRSALSGGDDAQKKDGKPNLIQF